MASEHTISDSERTSCGSLLKTSKRVIPEQIDQMQKWRDEWYPNSEQSFGVLTGMMNDGRMDQMMSGSMQEMVDSDTTCEMCLRINDLAPSDGRRHILSRHLKRFEHPELTNLAREIFDEQTIVIELMEGGLEEVEAAEGVGRCRSR